MGRGLPQYQVASWSFQPFGHNRHGPKIRGVVPLLQGGGLGPHLTECGLGQGLPPFQVAFWSIQPFSHNRRGLKIEGLCPFWGLGAGSPSNTMWPWPRPAFIRSGILIHPTIWPQCTDRADNGLIAYGEPFYKRSPKNWCCECEWNWQYGGATSCGPKYHVFDSGSCCNDARQVQFTPCASVTKHCNFGLV